MIVQTLFFFCFFSCKFTTEMCHERSCYWWAGKRK